MIDLWESVVEHIVAIIASMVRNCQGTQKQRLLNKFAESDHEKVMFLELMNHLSSLSRADEIDESSCDTGSFSVTWLLLIS